MNDELKEHTMDDLQDALKTTRKEEYFSSIDILEALNYKDREKFLKNYKKGYKLYSEGNCDKALPFLTISWKLEPKNKELLVILSDVLIKTKNRILAIDFLQKSVEANGPKADILWLCVQCAKALNLLDEGEALAEIYMNLYPDDWRGYHSRANVASEKEEFDKGIEILQDAISKFPDQPALWNLAGAIANLMQKDEAALPLYLEAQRLDPGNPAYFSNIARIYERCGDYEKAVEFDQKTLAINPEHMEANIGLGTSLLTLGELKEGWKHYGYRLKSRGAGDSLNSFHAKYSKKIPMWKGEHLKGKTIFVMGEQGLGDELMFSRVIPELQSMGARIVAGFANRFKSIFERTFPDIKFHPRVVQERENDMISYFPTLEKEMRDGALKIDYMQYVGTIAAMLWQTLGDISSSSEGFLTVCPKKRALWKARIDSIGVGPKVGLFWQSGQMSALRNTGYLKPDDIAPLLTHEHIHFVNLHYSDVSAQLEHLREITGRTIHDFGDLDQKSDLDSTMAMMTSLDLVIGVASAPGQMAMAVGTPVWWLFPKKVWWSFGADCIPFQPEGKCFHRQDKNWERAITAVSDSLAERFPRPTR